MKDGELIDESIKCRECKKGYLKLIQIHYTYTEHDRGDSWEEHSIDEYLECQTCFARFKVVY